jgi:hypothetical protein
LKLISGVDCVLLDKERVGNEKKISYNTGTSECGVRGIRKL